MVNFNPISGIRTETMQVTINTIPEITIKNAAVVINDTTNGLYLLPCTLR